MLFKLKRLGSIKETKPSTFSRHNGREYILRSKYRQINMVGPDVN